VTYISSILYTIIVGGLFIFVFIFLYDWLFGEKREKQIRKIHKYFRNENVQKVEMLEHLPKKYTLYQVKTGKETKRVKIKPGYKVIKMVQKKKEPAQ
jgi:heme/copper-type cytochrome/quinol oxidase subunit 1